MHPNLREPEHPGLPRLLAVLPPEELHVAVSAIRANLVEALLVAHVTELRGAKYTRECLHRIYRSATKRSPRTVTAESRVDTGDAA
jgi:hypothetical protein